MFTSKRKLIEQKHTMVIVNTGSPNQQVTQSFTYFGAKSYRLSNGLHESIIFHASDLTSSNLMAYGGDGKGSFSVTLLV